MKAHLIQPDSVWEDRAANYRKVRDLVASIRVEPGDLIVLPEMFDTGFSFALEQTCDTDGSTLDFLKSLSRELRCTLHGSRTVLNANGRGLNRATITGPSGEVLAEYDKLHLFSPGRESERFAAGVRVCTYSWGGLCAFPAICYDLRFPELFRKGLAMGSEIFVIGANWPTPREAHRRALSVARAIENQAFVLSVNRCGSDPHLGYSGGSLAVSPKGDVLADAGAAEGAVSVEIDPELVRAWRRDFSAWKDRRPDLAPPGNA